MSLGSMAIRRDDADRWFGRGSGALPTCAETTMAAGRFVEFLRHDPLVRRFVAEINTKGGKIRITDPWMAIAEQRTTAMLLAGIVQRGQRITDDKERSIPLTDAQDALGGFAVALALFRARTFLWTDETKTTADAAPLPRHTISPSILPFDCMYWSWETAYEQIDPRVTESDSKRESNWALLIRQDHGFGIIQDCALISGPGSPGLTISTGSIEFEKTFPDDFDAMNRRPTGYWLARLAFLNSPYIAPQRHHIAERAIRRDVELYQRKHDLPESDLSVNVVTLRAADHFTDSAHPRNLDGSVAWKNRWWVRGHLRNQWYESEGTHRLIWVREHLKGPESLPVKAETVYSVAR